MMLVIFFLPNGILGYIQEKLHGNLAEQTDAVEQTDLVQQIVKES
jgi:hypothetical protein